MAEVLPDDLLVAFSPYVAQGDEPHVPGDDRQLRPDRPRGTRQVERPIRTSTSWAMLGTSL